jgi:gliding motility-associated-like protein
MRKFPLIILFLTGLNILNAQTTIDLVVYYNFETIENDEIPDVTGNNSNDAQIFGNQLDCGVLGNGLKFNGLDNKAVIQGEAIDVFGTEDFTMSFYFKPIEQNVFGVQTLVSKRDQCDLTNAFSIRYIPNTKSISVLVSEDETLNANFDVDLDQTNCWHHVCLVRDGTELLLYLDGVLKEKILKPSRIDLTNDNIDLVLGLSTCTVTASNFEGVIDEFRLYDRALVEAQVEELYVFPDKIGNGFVDLSVGKDTILYLGNSIETFVTFSCANSVLWEPPFGVANVNDPSTILTPTESITYTLNFFDNYGCIASDTFRVNVIDPETLDCVSFLPNAFTPDGDGLNDDFGIDNPFAMTDFVSFSVIDRLSNIVFVTNDPFERWDGRVNGKEATSDNYYYQVIYRCGGVEEQKVGSVALMR